MSFKPTVGAAGIIHPSQAEAKLSFPFFDLGILSHDRFYPQPFADSKGESFKAKTDFRDKFVPDICIETKAGSLNGLGSCASAASAMARFEQAYANGFIEDDDNDYLKLMASWSASITKFKLVQLQEAASGRVVIMVYDKKPPAKTLARLEKSKVMWCIYGDADWQKFLSFRCCSKMGFASDWVIKGHLLQSHGGVQVDAYKH